MTEKNNIELWWGSGTPVTISRHGNFSPRICVVLNQRQGFNDPIGQEQSICPSVALPLLSRGDSPPHDNSRLWCIDSGSQFSHSWSIKRMATATQAIMVGEADSTFPSRLWLYQIYDSSLFKHSEIYHFQCITRSLVLGLSSKIFYFI